MIIIQKSPKATSAAQPPEGAVTPVGNGLTTQTLVVLEILPCCSNIHWW